MPDSDFPYKVNLASKVRKLAMYQTNDKAQYAVNLVRFVAETNPSRMVLCRTSSTFGVRSPSGGFTRKELEDIYASGSSAIDAGKAEGLLVLLMSALAISPKRIFLESSVGGEKTRLEIDENGNPNFSTGSLDNGILVMVEKNTHSLFDYETPCIRKKCLYSTAPIFQGKKQLSKPLKFPCCVVQEFTDSGITGVVGTGESRESHYDHPCYGTTRVLRKGISIGNLKWGYEDFWGIANCDTLPLFSIGRSLEQDKQVTLLKAVVGKAMEALEKGIIDEHIRSPFVNERTFTKRFFFDRAESSIKAYRSVAGVISLDHPNTLSLSDIKRHVLLAGVFRDNEGRVYSIYDLERQRMEQHKGIIFYTHRKDTKKPFVIVLLKGDNPYIFSTTSPSWRCAVQDYDAYISDAAFGQRRQEYLERTRVRYLAQANFLMHPFKKVEELLGEKAACATALVTYGSGISLLAYSTFDMGQNIVPALKLLAAAGATTASAGAAGAGVYYVVNRNIEGIRRLKQSCSSKLQKYAPLLESTADRAVKIAKFDIGKMFRTPFEWLSNSLNKTAEDEKAQEEKKRIEKAREFADLILVLDTVAKGVDRINDCYECPFHLVLSKSKKLMAMFNDGRSEHPHFGLNGNNPELQQLVSAIKEDNAFAYTVIPLAHALATRAKSPYADATNINSRVLWTCIDSLVYPPTEFFRQWYAKKDLSRLETEIRWLDYTRKNAVIHSLLHDVSKRFPVIDEWLASAFPLEVERLASITPNNMAMLLERNHRSAFLTRYGLLDCDKRMGLAFELYFCHEPTRESMRDIADSVNFIGIDLENATDRVVRRIAENKKGTCVSTKVRFIRERLAEHNEYRVVKELLKDQPRFLIHETLSWESYLEDSDE